MARPAKPEPAPRFIGFEDAAVRTGLSRSTLERLAGAGRLTVYRPGSRRCLFEIGELDKFILNSVSLSAEGGVDGQGAGEVRGGES
jgi:excisionase family DNA binding protein